MGLCQQFTEKYFVVALNGEEFLQTSRCSAADLPYMCLVNPLWHIMLSAGVTATLMETEFPNSCAAHGGHAWSLFTVCHSLSYPFVFISIAWAWFRHIMWPVLKDYGTKASNSMKGDMRVQMRNTSIALSHVAHSGNISMWNDLQIKTDRPLHPIDGMWLLSLFDICLQVGHNLHYFVICSL